MIWLRPEASHTMVEALVNARHGTFLGAVQRRHFSAQTRRWTVDGREIVWEENHLVGTRTVAIVAPLAGDELHEALLTVLPHYTREALEIDAATDLQALRVLAMMEASPEVDAHLRRWMRHRNRMVRHAVITLCRLVDRPGLREDFARRAAEDRPLALLWKALHERLS